MSEQNGISISKSTSPENRSYILKRAKKLLGEKVFLETFLFNYRGRLVSINEDHSLNVIILASDELFRQIRIDLGLVIEIGKLSCKSVSSRNEDGDFTSDDLWRAKRHSITVSERTSPQTQKRINRLAKEFKGEVVIVKTLIYHYVVCINNLHDSYITVHQLIDFDPHFAIEFRIDKNIIYDIVNFPI
ncbi:hypothetical protein ACFVR2_02655 [Gottfriedia sp. NPDC057991]|uniref:hypothetical protein n=1 Tax=Gottfriedia sp. NPDC057991 TaxID=3346298 RepID=UPI0036D8A95F